MSEELISVGSRLRDRRNIAAATVLSTAGVLPLFLTAAFAVSIRAEFVLDRLRFGIAIALFSIASAIMAVPIARVVERIDIRQAFRVSSSCVIGLACAAAFTPGKLGAFGFLMITCGCVNSLVQTTANLVIIKGVTPRRRGVGFALKQSSFGFAVLLSGLTVAVIDTVSWRWGLAVLGVVLGVAAMSLGQVPRLLVRRTVQTDPVAQIGGRLIRLTIAGFLGVAAMGAMEVFYVQSVSASGHSIRSAGLLFGMGGVFGIVARLFVGLAVDRFPRHSDRLLIALLLAGSVGYGSMGQADSMGTLVVVTFFVFAFGSAWSGLLVQSAVSTGKHSPARSSGLITFGMSSGAVVGPPLFGLVAQAADIAVAWWATAVLLASAGFMVVGSTRVSPEVGETQYCQRTDRDS